MDGHCACVCAVPSGLKSGCYILLAGVEQVVVSWSVRVLVSELGTAVRTAGAFNYRATSPPLDMTFSNDHSTVAGAHVVLSRSPSC